ncbi:iglr-3 [Pristionchus pacificus]|uniref:Iglr-3 n=1 Tax=Pristionchus pacificus TaxID=54126 RepID=A0A2A6C9J2_PRIPA|nr:iglr-3 [Pristionchus pacificus]|eukprot:PDM74875.1 iglr-3 [Pristionchus pacificus]
MANKKEEEETIHELVSGSTLKGAEDKGEKGGRASQSDAFRTTAHTHFLSWYRPFWFVLSLAPFRVEEILPSFLSPYSSSFQLLVVVSIYLIVLHSIARHPPSPPSHPFPMTYSHSIYDSITSILSIDYHRAMNLLTLRMDYCNISKIDPMALSPLINLISLDLSHNSLKILSMHPLRRLRTLLLSHNELQYLPDLSHFTSLRMVDLSCNRLVAISSVLLPPRIESLLIKKNALTAIPALPSLSILQELDISGNPLSCSCLLHPFLKWSLYLFLFDPSSFPCPLPLPSHCDLSIDGAANLTTVVSTKVIPEEELCCVLHGPRNATFFWERNEKRQHPSRVESIQDGLALRSCFIARFHGLISCRAEYGNSTVSRQFSIEAPPAVLAFEEDILFYLIFSTILLLLLIPSILIINRYCSIPSSSLTTTISSTPSSPEVSEWESVTPRALLNQPPIARSESVISIVHSLP